MVISLSLDLLQEYLGDFEKNTRSIGSKLLRQMGYNGNGLRKITQGIISPILDELRVKLKGLEKAMTTKITFVKGRDVL